MTSGKSSISNQVAKKRRINRDMDSSRFLVILEHGEYEIYFNKLRAAKKYLFLHEFPEIPLAYCVGRRLVFGVNLLTGKRVRVCRVH